MGLFGTYRYELVLREVNEEVAGMLDRTWETAGTAGLHGVDIEADFAGSTKQQLYALAERLHGRCLTGAKQRTEQAGEPAQQPLPHGGCAAGHCDTSPIQHVDAATPSFGRPVASVVFALALSCIALVLAGLKWQWGLCAILAVSAGLAALNLAAVPDAVRSWVAGVCEKWAARHLRKELERKARVDYWVQQKLDWLSAEFRIHRHLAERPRQGANWA